MSGSGGRLHGRGGSLRGGSGSGGEVRRERQEAGQLVGLGTTRDSGQAVSNDPGPGCGWTCKNGKRCRYRKMGKCRFVHPDEKCPGCEALGGHE